MSHGGNGGVLETSYTVAVPIYVSISNQACEYLSMESCSACKRDENPLVTKLKTTAVVALTQGVMYIVVSGVECRNNSRVRSSKAAGIGGSFELVPGHRVTVLRVIKGASAH